jgi:hypothetical protein
VQSVRSDRNWFYQYKYWLIIVQSVQSESMVQNRKLVFSVLPTLLPSLLLALQLQLFVPDRQKGSLHNICMTSEGKTPGLSTEGENTSPSEFSTDSSYKSDSLGWSSESLSYDTSESDLKMAAEEEVQIGGITVKLATTAKILQAVDTPMFKKGDRKVLSEDKRNDLFEKATKNVLTKFDLLSLSIKDEDKLDETYNIHILLAKMRAHLVKYDMHDVFTVLQVEANGKTIKGETKDLFSSYPTLIESNVAKSNKWYNTWPADETFRENLQLTYQFLENNTTERLWDKCMEVYDKYNAPEKQVL